MIIDQIRDFPGTSIRAVYPDVSFGYLTQLNLAGGESVVIMHGISYLAATVPVASLWLTGTKPIFSWTMDHVTANHPGAILQVEASYEGSFLRDFKNYYIAPNDTTYMAGLYIPGFAVRFTIINSSPSDNMFISATIRQQGME